MDNGVIEPIIFGDPNRIARSADALSSDISGLWNEEATDERTATDASLQAPAGGDVEVS